MLQARDGRLRKAAAGEAVTPDFFWVLLVLPFLVFVLAAGGPQVEEEGLVVLLLLPFLPASLRLSLIIQQQVRVVVATAVRHHHRADGAGVDVLDLEEALDHVDVLRFHVLFGEVKDEKKMHNCTNIMTQFILLKKNKTFAADVPAEEDLWPTYLEGFVEPENRAGRHVADPVQVPRDQVGLVQPAAEDIVGLVPHTRQQRVVFCGGVFGHERDTL